MPDANCCALFMVVARVKGRTRPNAPHLKARTLYVRQRTQTRHSISSNQVDFAQFPQSRYEEFTSNTQKHLLPNRQ